MTFLTDEFTKYLPGKIFVSVVVLSSPDKGLEPLALGLKVPRSTNWANRALFATNF